LAFKVDSQVHEFYAIDWRRGNSTLEFVPTETPSSLQEKLLDLMRAMDLFSGSIDMIVDPEGQYWFLEKFCDNAVAKVFAEEFLLKLHEGQFSIMGSSAA